MKKKGGPKHKIRLILGCLSVLFVLINIIFAIQAYHFTHFSDSTNPKTEISDAHNIKTIFTGVHIPKPIAQEFPDIDYDSIQISNGNDYISAWIMKTSSEQKKGLVILFHGYTAEKSQMLDYAYEILGMGYDAMLVDFRASGQSSGYQSTMGYKEAKDVKLATEYAERIMNENKIILFGFSMGATAIIKAQHDYTLPVNGIIAEASYSNFRNTIKNRAKLVGPDLFSNIASYVFCFWVAVVNFIDPFSMEPDEYVKNIHVPTLIACGSNDQYINSEETLKIFNNLESANKVLKIYDDSKHGLYIYEHNEEWRNTVETFLKSVE